MADEHGGRRPPAVDEGDHQGDRDVDIERDVHVEGDVPVERDPHAAEVLGSVRPPHDGAPDRDRPLSPVAAEPKGFWGVTKAVVKEIVIVVVMASVLSLIIKTWLIQAFWIPSGSMEQTLIRDDRVIVSKLTPRVFDLRRGDIVVFEDPGAPDHPWINELPHAPRSGAQEKLHEALTFIGLLPDDSENHLIKRVIGLPGDHITASGEGPIAVNGVTLEEPYLPPGTLSSAMEFDIVVPDDKIWVMGDNRSDSSDSRFHPVGGDGTEGSVPIAKVTGRAILLVWPLDRWTGLGQPSEVFAKVPAPQ
jgi:signal peptidase I